MTDLAVGAAFSEPGPICMPWQSMARLSDDDETAAASVAGLAL